VYSRALPNADDARFLTRNQRARSDRVFFIAVGFVTLMAYEIIYINAVSLGKLKKSYQEWIGGELLSKRLRLVVAKHTQHSTNKQ
jgi:hypothetical protein